MKDKVWYRGFKSDENYVIIASVLFSHEVGPRLHQLVLYQCIWAPKKRVGMAWHGMKLAPVSVGCVYRKPRIQYGIEGMKMFESQDGCRSISFSLVP